MSEKITQKTIVNTSELATISGLTIRRIQQLIQDGTIPTVERGKINLSAGIRALVRHSSRNLTAEDIRIERKRRKADADLKASKAEILRLEAEEMFNRMHRAEDVEAVTNDMVYTIRAALLSLPGRLAGSVAEAATPPEASAVIRKEILNTLTELSDYEFSPERYSERLREREALGDRFFTPEGENQTKKP